MSDHEENLQAFALELAGLMEKYGFYSITAGASTIMLPDVGAVAPGSLLRAQVVTRTVLLARSTQFYPAMGDAVSESLVKAIREAAHGAAAAADMAIPAGPKGLKN